MDRVGGDKEKMRKYREWISLHLLILSPFPLHFLILSPFSHSPAVTSCATLGRITYFVGHGDCKMSERWQYCDQSTSWTAVFWWNDKKNSRLAELALRIKGILANFDLFWPNCASAFVRGNFFLWGETQATFRDQSAMLGEHLSQKLTLAHPLNPKIWQKMWPEWLITAKFLFAIFV